MPKIEMSKEALLSEIADLRRENAELKSDNADLEAMLDMNIEHADSLEEDLFNKIDSTLRESERRFRTISETIPVPIIVIRRSDGFIVYANEPASSLIGFSVEELLNRKAADFYDPADFSALSEILAIQEYVSDYECRGRRADGKPFWAALFIRPLTFSDEPCLLNALYDMADRKQAEENIRRLNEELEQRVRERTEELNQKNVRLLEVNQKLESALSELQRSQAQLIQSEKMAALGQLIAGVAHEINTPVGAIRASAGNISDSLKALERFPALFQFLSEERREDFFALIRKSMQNEKILSSREERKLKRSLIRVLEEHELEDADTVADTLTDMGVYDNIDLFLPLMRDPEIDFILETAYDISGLHRGSRNIIAAADRASKVVFALKSYVHYDHSGERIDSDLTEGIETVLTLYDNQLKQGIEVIRNYDELPPVPCYPDELNQVWTNIIHNAIQAMENSGTLKIDVRLEDNRAVVAFTDSGKGIPDEIRERIFEPFFTTKGRGEGSGLGLDIVRKIVEKHNGEIRAESEPGKTVFSVMLPID